MHLRPLTKLLSRRFQGEREIQRFLMLNHALIGREKQVCAPRRIQSRRALRAAGGA